MSKRRAIKRKKFLCSAREGKGSRPITASRMIREKDKRGEKSAMRER